MRLSKLGLLSTCSVLSLVTLFDVDAMRFRNGIEAQRQRKEAAQQQLQRRILDREERDARGMDAVPATSEVPPVIERPRRLGVPDGDEAGVALAQSADRERENRSFGSSDSEGDDGRSFIPMLVTQGRGTSSRFAQSVKQQQQRRGSAQQQPQRRILDGEGRDARGMNAVPAVADSGGVNVRELRGGTFNVLEEIRAVRSLRELLGIEGVSLQESLRNEIDRLLTLDASQRLRIEEGPASSEVIGADTAAGDAPGHLVSPARGVVSESQPSSEVIGADTAAGGSESPQSSPEASDADTAVGGEEESTEGSLAQALHRALDE